MTILVLTLLLLVLSVSASYRIDDSNSTIEYGDEWYWIPDSTVSADLSRTYNGT
jgi:hypothetical protein